MRERRGSLETLGLARIHYEGLTEEADRDFFGRWAAAFGICGVCGAVRSPFQSDAEIEEFEEYHKGSCGAGSTEWAALHVDFRSDLLGEHAWVVELTKLRQI